MNDNWEPFKTVSLARRRTAIPQNEGRLRCLRAALAWRASESQSIRIIKKKRKASSSNPLPSCSDPERPKVHPLVPISVSALSRHPPDVGIPLGDLTGLGVPWCCPEAPLPCSQQHQLGQTQRLVQPLGYHPKERGPAVLGTQLRRQ